MLWPPTDVVETSIVKFAVWLFPPVMVKLQCPMATGVTVKVVALVPEPGETVAIPLHVGEPFATVNVPL
jgi:hypothetical protein